jgi:hydrogenase maturation protease
MKKREGSSNISPGNTIILGVGNELLSDEGVGVHLVREIKEREIPAGVTAVEGGTDGFGLLNIITEADRLILIDSLKGGGKPGSIYKFDIKDAPKCPDIFKTSVHQVGILEVINLSGLVGKTPKTTVIGIEPKKIDIGLELSPEVKKKIPRVIELIFEVLKKTPTPAPRNTKK